MKKIRILHIISGLGQGGAENMLYKLLCASHKEEFENEVVSLKRGGDYKQRITDLNIKVHDVGLSLTKIRSIIRTYQPHIIQGWMCHGNTAASLSTFFLSRNTPLIWNIRQSLEALKTQKLSTQLLIKLGAYFSKQPQKSIFNSSTSIEQHRQFGYHTENASLIANGFDVNFLKPDVKARKQFRKELNISENDILMGMVARYHPVKDFQNFINAAALLRKEFSNVKFVLVGEGVNQKNVELTQPIQELGLQESLFLLDKSFNIPYILSGLDIMTLTSLSEGFPNVIGEAMACELPCVVTHVGDCAQIVADTGIIVPPQDPQAVKAAWAKLIQMGGEERSALGKKARKRVCDLYSLDKIGREYEEVYRRLLQRG